MPAARSLVLVTAAALIDPDGRVLIAQRPEGKAMTGLWEFPGGKVENGESPEDALVRELSEELGIAVKPACLAPFTFASHTYESFRLLMPLYVCRRWDGTPEARVHAGLKWIRPRALMARREEFPMPEADYPLLPMLRDLL
jgi:8-oxo-dGTP diphosphatase